MIFTSQDRFSVFGVVALGFNQGSGAQRGDGKLKGAVGARDRCEYVHALGVARGTPRTIWILFGLQEGATPVDRLLDRDLRGEFNLRQPIGAFDLSKGGSDD